METVKIILIVAGTTVVLANLFVSYRVAASELFEPAQKIAQCVMIWLLPVLGAGLAYALMQEPKKPTRRYSDGVDNSAGCDGFGTGYGDAFHGGHSGGGHDGH
jgi:hypothetical protein